MGFRAALPPGRHLTRPHRLERLLWPLLVTGGATFALWFAFGTPPWAFVALLPLAAHHPRGNHAHT